MPRRLLRACLVIGLALASAAPAAAQGGPADAEPPTALAPLATTSPPGPAPTATPSATNDKPARGPAVRERGGRRSRAGSSATGALFLVILVGFMGYYVMKKLRR